jgi:hypothetical protein
VYAAVCTQERLKDRAVPESKLAQIYAEGFDELDIVDVVRGQASGDLPPAVDVIDDEQPPPTAPPAVPLVIKVAPPNAGAAKRAAAREAAKAAGGSKAVPRAVKAAPAPAPVAPPVAAPVVAASSTAAAAAAAAAAADTSAERQPGESKEAHEQRLRERALMHLRLKRFGGSAAAAAAGAAATTAGATAGDAAQTAAQQQRAALQQQQQQQQQQEADARRREQAAAAAEADRAATAARERAREEARARAAAEAAAAAAALAAATAEAEREAAEEAAAEAAAERELAAQRAAAAAAQAQREQEWEAARRETAAKAAAAAQRAAAAAAEEKQRRNAETAERARQQAAREAAELKRLVDERKRLADEQAARVAAAAAERRAAEQAAAAAAAAAARAAAAAAEQQRRRQWRAVAAPAFATWRQWHAMQRALRTAEQERRKRCREAIASIDISKSWTPKRRQLEPPQHSGRFSSRQNPDNSLFFRAAVPQLDTAQLVGSVLVKKSKDRCKSTAKLCERLGVVCALSPAVTLWKLAVCATEQTAFLTWLTAALTRTNSLINVVNGSSSGEPVGVVALSHTTVHTGSKQRGTGAVAVVNSCVSVCAAAVADPAVLAATVQGATALVYAVRPRFESEAAMHELWHSDLAALEAMINTVAASSTTPVAVPLIIAVSEQVSVQRGSETVMQQLTAAAVEHGLQLAALPQQYISAVHLCRVPSNSDVAVRGASLEAAVLIAAAHSPQPPVLACAHVQDLVTLWLGAALDEQQCSVSANDVIAAVLAGLYSLALLTTGAEQSQVAYPAPEFAAGLAALADSSISGASSIMAQLPALDWNSEETLLHWRRCIESLVLPELPEQLPADTPRDAAWHYMQHYTAELPSIAGDPAAVWEVRNRCLNADRSSSTSITTTAAGDHSSSTLNWPHVLSAVVSRSVYALMDSERANGREAVLTFALTPALRSTLQELLEAAEQRRAAAVAAAVERAEQQQQLAALRRGQPLRGLLALSLQSDAPPLTAEEQRQQNRQRQLERVAQQLAEPSPLANMPHPKAAEHWELVAEARAAHEKWAVDKQRLLRMINL